MTLSRRTCSLVALSLLVVLAGGVVAADATDPFDPVAQQDIDADEVVMVADVAEDGNAQFRVEYRIRLDTADEQQAFEELQADVGADPSAYLDPFVDRMEQTVADAQAATGREMATSEFAVETDRRTQPDTAIGVVTYQFTWSGFAAVEDGTVRAGDALDRLFLDDGVQLQLRWPSSLELTNVSPENDRLTVEDERVVWRGPLDFDTGQPRVVLQPADATGDDSADGGGTDGETDDGADAGDGGVPWVLVGAAAVLALVALAALGLRRTGPFADRSADDPVADTDGAAADDSAAGTDGPPPELLSNEERVLQLLEDNGGRMKQGAVAEQLDWTAAKTSQVVGDLREADEVESFRLGRENVLTLPDVDLESDLADEGEE